METHEVNSYAASVGAQVLGTSAKSGKGVQELFLELTKKLLEKERAKPTRNGRAKSRGPRTKIDVDDDEKPNQNSGGGCCTIL